MTSDMKCPFCQQELRNCCAGVIYTCSKPDSCPHEQCYGSKELWQALIQAKQDLEQSEKCCSAWETQALDYKAEVIALSGKLEIATSALYEICNDYQEDSSERAEKALEQIEHKE